MSRGTQKFTQGDVAKAIKGAVKAGLEVQRLEITDGKIVVVAGKAVDVLAPAPAENPWDKV